jgi:hypothetical protein
MTTPANLLGREQIIFHTTTGSSRSVATHTLKLQFQMKLMGKGSTPTGAAKKHHQPSDA